MTGKPNHVSRTSAVLTGVVTPNAHAVVTFVLTNQAGAGRLSLLHKTLTGLAPTTLSVRVGGLKPGHRYRYRVAVTRLDGTTAGATRTFATRPRRL